MSLRRSGVIVLRVIEVTGEKTIEAPAGLVWELVGHRFDRIADWASAIRTSRANPEAAATTEAPVAGRVCETSVPMFGRVSETILSYDEAGMTLAYEAVELPGFIAAARNRLRVSPIDERSSRVDYEATIETRGPLGRLLEPPLRLRVRRLARRSMNDLAEHLEQAGAPSRRGRRQVSFNRRIDAPIDVAWDVVSDVVGFGDAAPSLSRTEVLEGEGAGMQRRCYDSRGRGWDEVCTLWDEGHRYGMRVKTETYPFPLRQMFRGFQGAWEVEPAETGTLVSMHYDVELSPVGRLLWLPLRRTFVRQCDLLLDNWEREIRMRAVAAAPGRRPLRRAS